MLKPETIKRHKQRRSTTCPACHRELVDTEYHGQNIIAVIAAGFLALVLVMAFSVQAHASGDVSRHLESVDTAILAQMESSGNVFARNGEHYGLCQISRPVLADYNRTYGTIWGVQDLFNGVINLRIADWYVNSEIMRLLKHYGLRDTLENRLTAWRLGIKSVLSNRQAVKYTRKYREIRDSRKKRD